MQFCWEKIDNSKLLNVYKHKGLVPMFTNKDFYGWFQLCLLLNPFQNGLYIFGWLSVRIPCQIIFVNKHWPQSCLCPFNGNYNLCASGDRVIDMMVNSHFMDIPYYLIFHVDKRHDLVSILSILLLFGPKTKLL